SKSDYANWMYRIKQIRAQKHSEFASGAPFSDFAVYNNIFSHLPKQSMLQLSNSAAIRYAQLFPIHESISVYCNRGTSGIDGSTSTAIGAACASERPTVLVTGDISFFYDSNALWNQYVPDRKSTRLNSSHVKISYAVFCLKKEKYMIMWSSREHRYRRTNSY